MKSAPKKRNVILGLVLLLLFIIGMVGIVAATGWEETLEHLARVGWGQFGILLLLSLVNYLARALRWRVYTKALNIPTGLLQDFRHYLGGFALTITPGRIGELIRLRWINRDTGTPLERAAPLVLVDRAADLVSVALVLALATALTAGGLAGAVPVVIIAIIVAIIATQPKLLVWSITRGWKTIGRLPRLFGGLRRAAKQLHVFAKAHIILPALLLGAIGWFAEGYAFYLLLGWLGADITMWMAVAIFLFAMLGGGATGMPGGLGGAEVALIGLLTLQGVPLEISLPATAIIRLTTLWFAILIGIGVFPFNERFAKRAL
ncbi:MAG: flippase-like domain-containing protein [Rhodobacteraceae bacterium]|nr:flippase-like domain-containing protein [Paracoccaceae bacterium]